VRLRDGDDLTIAATGPSVGAALVALTALASDGITARVLNVHTVKPIDREAIACAARETGRLLTVEEHSIVGGLGAAVAEVLAELGTGRLARVGVRDVFCTEIGPYPELLRLHGLDASGIERAARASSRADRVGRLMAVRAAVVVIQGEVVRGRHAASGPRRALHHGWRRPRGNGARRKLAR
jgi:transketolase C-terminal domain/subunit